MTNDYFYLGAAPDNPERLFVFPISTAQRHGVITGRTGGGKTGLIDDLCGQFIAAVRGFTVMDCKGDLADDVVAMLAMTPEEGWPELARDVVLVDPSDRLCTATFNPLEVPPYTTPARQRQDVRAILRRLWGIDDAQTARMVLVLRKTMQLLMFHQLTIVEAPRVLTDQTFRERLVQSCDDAQLRRFWLHEFPEGTTNQLAWTQSSLIRLESLVDDPNVCAFLGQPRSSLNFREIMDQGKICIVSLGRGKLGHESANLIAGLLLVHLQLAAESRQRLPQDQR